MQLQALFGSMSSWCSSLQRHKCNISELVSQKHSQGPRFQPDFARMGIWEEVFFFYFKHTDTQNPLCKIVLQIKIALLLRLFGQSKKKYILKSKMLMCLRSQGCEPT